MLPWTATKKMYANVVVPPAPIQVPNQWPLALNAISVVSLANDKGDNKMKLEAVTEKNPL